MQRLLPSNGIADGFGNNYGVHEIRVPPKPPQSGPESCTNSFDHVTPGGAFHLHFEDAYLNPLTTSGYGFDDCNLGTARQAVAAQVFDDLEAFLALNNRVGADPVHIQFMESGTNTNMPNSLGFANAYRPVVPGTSGGFSDDPIWITLNTGLDYFSTYPGTYQPNNFNPAPNPPAAYYYGYIRINFGFSFHLDFNNPITNTDVDLYSLILHEAIHMLGMKSYILSTGNSVQADQTYSRYDRFLETAAGTRLVSNTNNCYQTSYQAQPSELFQGCNNIVFNGVNNPNQVVHSPFNTFNFGSSLSHFLCTNSTTTCPGVWGVPFGDHLMTFCGGAGNATAYRRPNQAEAFTLCDLGYGINSTYPRFPNITYQTCASSCTPVAINDFDPTDPDYVLTTGITQTTIMNILNNDVVPPGFTPLQVSCLELITPGAGTLTPVGLQGFQVNFNPAFQGWAVVRYIPESSSCSGQANFAYVFIFVQGGGVNCSGPCDPCDNLICGGDLDYLTDIKVKPISSFSILSANQEVGTFQSGAGNDPELYPDPSFPIGFNCPDPFDHCGLFSNAILPCPRNVTCPSGCNTPSFAPGKYIGMMTWQVPGFNIIDAVHFELCQDLIPGVQYEFSVWAYTGCQVELDLVFSEEAPCTPLTPIQTINHSPFPAYGNPILGSSTTCANGTVYDPVELVQLPITGTVDPITNDLDWQEFTVQFTVTTPNIKYVVIHLDPENITPPKYSYLDDFNIRFADPDPLSITATAIPAEVCQSETTTVEFVVCHAPGLTPPPSVVTALNLPAGVDVADPANPGDFVLNMTSGQYEATIIDTDYINDCVTLTVDVVIDPGTAPGQYPVGLTIVQGACVTVVSSATVDLTVRPRPVVTKTYSTPYPIPGETVTATIQVCNFEMTTLTGLTVQDQIPILQPGTFNSNDFTIVNGLNIETQPFSLLPAPSPGIPYCVTFTYTFEFPTNIEERCSEFGSCATLMGSDCPVESNCDVLTLVLADRWLDPGSPAQNAGQVLYSSLAQPIQPGESVAFWGELVIDQTIVWDDIELIFLPGSKITIEPANFAPGNLTIQNNSWLYSCKEMWEGIEINDAGNTSTVFINSGSKVQDAIAGLRSMNGGFFELDNAVFVNNYEHVVVEGATNITTRNIFNSEFLCDASLLPPFQGQITENAIRVDDADDVQIGQVNPFAGNTINYSMQGIMVRNSDINIEGNTISDIKHQGIWAIGPQYVGAILFPPKDILIEGNTIENTLIGARIDQGYQPTLRDNDFREFWGGVSIHPGITVSSTQIQVLDKNLFEGGLIGGLMIGDAPYCRIRVYDNDFVDAGQFGVYSSYMGSILRGNWGSYLTKTFNHNRISGLPEGIKVHGYPYVYIYRNDVSTANAPIGPNNHIAISAERDQYTRIHYNNVTNNNTSAARRGFHTASCTDLFMSCNTPTTTGRAMTFSGNNTLAVFGTGSQDARLVKNDIDDATDGMVLLTRAAIGHQGNTGLVYDNTWMNISGCEIEVTNSSPRTNFNYRNTGLEYNPDQKCGVNAFNIQVNGNPPGDDCAIESQIPLKADPNDVGDLEWVASLEAIAEGNLDSAITDLYPYQRPLYEFLVLDSVGQLLAQQGGILGEFTAIWDNKAAGGLVNIALLVDSGRIHEALTLNQGVSAENEYESYEQIVNTIWLQKQLYPAMVLDSSAIQHLETIAMLCWDIGGPATGRARDMLVFHRLAVMDTLSQPYAFPDDDCTPGEAYRMQESWDTSMPEHLRPDLDYSLSIVPNPANSSILLQYNGALEGELHFSLMSGDGKTLIDTELSLENSGLVTSVKHLAPGLYFGIWRLNGQVLKGERLMIIR